MKLLLETLSLAYIDFWNITGMSMVLLLIPLARKKTHVIVFIVAEYISFVCIMFNLCIYIGIDKFISKWVDSFIGKYPELVGILSLIASALLILCSIVFYMGFEKEKMVDIKKWLTLVKSNDEKQSVKSVHSVFLVVLGIIETVISMP